MNPERWREIERLLGRQSEAVHFIESPALDVAAREFAKRFSTDPAPDLVGRMLRHSKIPEKIRVFSMGVVCRARDERLKRDVAIKLFPPELMVDTERKQRVVQEARAASAFSHPNIVTIHDVISEDGSDFIVKTKIGGYSFPNSKADIYLHEKPANWGKSNLSPISQKISTNHCAIICVEVYTWRPI